MAIVIEHTPVDYSSAHDRIVYTVFESVKAIDPVTYPSYQYVADIYINGIKVTTQKAVPHPDDARGVFNLTTVIRNHVSVLFNPATQIQAQEFGNTQFHAKVVVKFGEEYGGTMYTNLTVDSERLFYNHYNGRMIGVYTILNNWTNKAATSRPLNLNIRRDSKFCFIPVFRTAATAYNVVIKTYDSSGTLTGTQTKALTPSAVYMLHQLNVSPVAVNVDYPAFIDTATVAFYTVQIDDGLIYKYTFNCERIYQTYTLHFLNQFGGFESFDFPKLSRSSYEIESKSFAKISYENDGSTFAGVVVNEDSRTYNVNFKEKITLNSDNIKQDCYKWLAQLILSPIKYIEVDGFLLPCKINASNYEFKTRVNDKVFNLTVEVNYNDILNTQYL